MESVGEKNGYFELQEATYSKVAQGYTRFAESDLLWAKITPCMQNGKAAVIRGLHDKVGFGSTEFHVLRPKSAEISMDFLWSVLTLDSFLFASQAAFTGSAGQQRVPAAFLESLPVPLPDKGTQIRLVKEIEAARQARQAKLAQANELLSSLDAYLLAQLGLAPPDKNTRQTFAVPASQVWSRCDVDYHSPKFRKLREAIENGVYPVVDVGSICQSLESGFAAGRDDQAFDDEDGIPHIRPTNITAYGELTLKGTKYVPRDSIKGNDLLQKNEVLFNNTNSTEWVGKTTVFDGSFEAAASNHITRLTLNNNVAEPYFIATLFNAFRSLKMFGLLSTNFNNQAGINTATLAAFRIPLPPPNLQQRIADEVQDRKEQAQRIRSTVAKDWAEAKARFERKLLGEEA